MLDIPKKYRTLIVIRTITGFIGIGGLFNAVKYMPISQANCIYFTSPMFLAVMAYFALNEKLSVYDIVSLISAFIGVILINDPFG